MRGFVLVLIIAFAPAYVRSTDWVGEENLTYFKVFKAAESLGERVNADFSYFCFFPAGIYSNVMSAGAGEKYFLILDEFSEEDKITLPEKFPPSQRWRAVMLNPIVTNRDKISAGDVLVLNLFPDAEYIAHIERVDENVRGVVTVSGRLKNYPGGHIIITTADNETLVEIRIPQKKEIYRIQGDPEQAWSYLLELDIEKMDIKEGGPPLVPPNNLSIKQGAY